MKITARANAKINLTLDIIGVREDGYHTVDMIMQSISLYDTVTVEKIDSGIKVTSSDMLLGGENDITYKAAKLFFEATKISGGTNITILKKIPVAAGLGGGSADAAAVLIILNRLYGNPLTINQLEKIALDLGADVPFFLYGGTISVLGIGEVLKELPPMPQCFIVIAKKSKKSSTKQMYALIDSQEKLDSPNNVLAIKAINENDLYRLCKNVKNVFSAVWEPDGVKVAIEKFSPLAIELSGSGPSYFSIFDNEENAKSCVEALNKSGIEAYLTTPQKKAIIFE